MLALGRPLPAIWVEVAAVDLRQFGERLGALEQLSRVVSRPGLRDLVRLAVAFNRGLRTRGGEERPFAERRVYGANAIDAAADGLRHRNPARHALLVRLRALEDASKGRRLRLSQIDV